MFRNPFVAPFPTPEVPCFQPVEQRARMEPDRPALVWAPTGQVVTYGHLWTASGKVARALQEMGVGKGDRVALIAANALAHPVAFYGILRAGGVVVPLNPLLKPAEVERCLGEVEACVVMASPEWSKDLRTRALPSVRHILNLEELLEAAEPFGDPEPVSIRPDRDLACILFSSGTTGLPKGTRLTHRNVLANVLAARALGFVGEGAVYVHFLPFSHCMGLLTLLNAGVCAGARQILLPQFEAQEVLYWIEYHRATQLYAVPPALRALVEAAETRGFGYRGLRFVNTAALPLDPELQARAERVFGCPVTEHIGMTECAGLMNLLLPPMPWKPRSVGPPVPNLEERVVDPDTGRDLGPGEVGELVVRGPMVTVGYWRNPEADEEASLEGGWFRTGDLVRFDESGYMWWVDRRKEMIKYKGYSIAPAELEEVLRQHPAVREACVIPKPDPEVGQIPKAFVVLQGEVTAAELLRFVEERVAPYKKVREVEFVSELPKSAVGKVLRKVLAEQERRRSAEATATRS
ncbi:MAG: AMP-binding protein [Armatimonadota bacterium]|nr:AMP-binding protein [Armatimonadota bacterium]MDR7445028.1 AMP-binding protein [Armatimonadota bacterium]MDR7570114.1 AMP-binding protein [Armatimonadota bacterium]MDR7614716.1 AMP-binding protein [Armatimonadota bacterium]